MKLRKITALLLCVILVFSFSACGKDTKDSGEDSPPSFVRGDVNFADMVFAEYDDTEFNDIVDALDEAITKDGNEKEVRELVEKLIAEYDKLTDAYE